MSSIKKLSRIKYKKIYKNKGYEINVFSNFKSTQEIISRKINEKICEEAEVKHIDPKDIEYTPTPINKYDKAKILARKYKHLDRALLRMSRMKITTDNQVSFINDTIARKSSPKS